MKIELEEKDIAKILLAHIRKIFPGDWKVSFDRSYSRVEAEFSLRESAPADLPSEETNILEEK